MKRRAKHHDDELRQHQHDPAEWSAVPEQVMTPPSQTAVVSLRLAKDEFLALTRAARNAGQSLSDYLRDAINSRQERDAVATHPE